MGIIETNTSLLNYLIVLGKYFIWNCRKQNNFPKFYLFTSFIKTEFKTEHYIAAKNNAYKRFDSKWGFLRNYLEPREIKKTIYKYVQSMSVISIAISAQFRKFAFCQPVN